MTRFYDTNMAASIPPGLPTEVISGEMAWAGAELETNPSLFDEHLSSDDIADIEAAVKHFQGLERSTKLYKGHG